MTTRLVRALAYGLVLAIAAPAFAADTAADAKDTATEKKAQTKKKARAMKPGGETTRDRMNDAKDTAKETKAKAKKKGRKAHRKARAEINRQTTTK
jgi:Ni/Co efflux regulator RcnB